MGFGVWGLGFRVSGSGFRNLRFRVWGSGFRVEGLGRLDAKPQTPKSVHPRLDTLTRALLQLGCRLA